MVSRVRIKRVYDPPEGTDGLRVLVDRLWPRGVPKEELAHDPWRKDLAPSAELRSWYGHDPRRWAAFRARYRAELLDKHQALAELARKAGRRPITLLTATRDVRHGHVQVLRELLEERFK